MLMCMWENDAVLLCVTSVCWAPYRSSEGSCSPEAISYTIRSLVEKVCYTSSVYCVAYQKAIAAIHFVLDDTLM